MVQDLFLNETARFAHVFLPGSSFLEKNGTFTNAERRISPVRKVMPPLAGMEDWEITVALSNALGYPMPTSTRREIMDEIARLTPTFTGVSYAKLDRLGSIQWPCNEGAPEGTPVMHVGQFVRGKGKFILTEYIPTDERATGSIRCCSPPAACSASTTSVPRPGAPRTTAGITRTCWRSIPTTPSSAASARGTGSA